MKNDCQKMILRGALVCSLLSVVTGCQTLSWNTGKDEVLNAEIANELPDLSKHEAPTKLVAIWSDTTYSRPGTETTRGLGGRLYFYDDNQNVVPVNGQLVVYGFDDSRPGPASRTPDRRYVITPKEFQAHFSTTDIGPSYSVWIPWDKLTPEHAKMSVVPVFTTIAGKVVMGDHSRHLLPGTSSGSPALPGATPPEAQPPRNVELASYQAESTGPQSVMSHREALTQEAARIAAAERLRTTRIGLPRSVQQRLIQSEASPVSQTATLLRERELARSNQVITTRRGTSDGLVPQNAARLGVNPQVLREKMNRGQPDMNSAQVVPSDLPRPVPQRWTGGTMPRPDRSGLSPPRVPSGQVSPSIYDRSPSQQLPATQGSGPAETSVYYGPPQTSGTTY